MGEQQSIIGTQMDIPEPLFRALQQHIDDKGLTWEQVTAAAFSLYLLQSGTSDKEINRIYLESLFGYQS